MKNKQSPTPGPWYVGESTTGAIRIRFSKGDSKDTGIVASVHCTSSWNEESNAHLVASAPKLLAVLREVEICGRVNSPITDGSPMYKAVVAAIAKAEGNR